MDAHARFRQYIVLFLISLVFLSSTATAWEWSPDGCSYEISDGYCYGECHDYGTESGCDKDIDCCLDNGYVWNVSGEYPSYFEPVGGTLTADDFGNLCCGDDNNATVQEHYIVCAGDCVTGDGDACCDQPTDCVADDSLCYPGDADTTSFNTESCHNATGDEQYCEVSGSIGEWFQDGDHSPGACGCAEDDPTCVGDACWNVGGDAVSPPNDLCCGDDVNETYIPAASAQSDGTDACCDSATDCVSESDCFTPEPGTADASDGGEMSCDSTGTFRGYCTEGLGGAGSWTQNSDSSPDACCCLSSGYWDSGWGCCDAGEEWLSSGQGWACKNSAVFGDAVKSCEGFSTIQAAPIPVTECQSMTVNSVKYWWDGLGWGLSAPAMCGCVSNAECGENASCISSVCMEPVPPDLILSTDMLDIGTGGTAELILFITNNLLVTDNLALNLDGSSPEMVYWSWFKGEKYTPYRNAITIPVKAKSSKQVSIEVQPALAGTYALKINAQSQHIPAPDGLVSGSAAVRAVQIAGEGTAGVATPGMGLLQLIVIALAGALVSSGMVKRE